MEEVVRWIIANAQRHFDAILQIVEMRVDILRFDELLARIPELVLAQIVDDLLEIAIDDISIENIDEEDRIVAELKRRQLSALHVHTHWPVFDASNASAREVQLATAHLDWVANMAATAKI